jgi:colanic acid biosynthesis glycosyl transferase WcaI
MKLLVVSQYFWPENFRVNDLVAEMVRRGHEVTVLTGIPNYPEGRVDAQYRKNPKAFADFRGARIVRVPMAPRGTGTLRLLWNYFTFAISACLLAPWALRGEKYDAIFVCQLSPVTSALPGVLLRWLKHAPMVMWVLDLWPESLLAVGATRSHKILSLVGRLTSFIYHQCDLVLAQSRSFVSLIAKRAGPHTRVEYFPNWAEVIFESANCAPAVEVPDARGVFSIMFAGNIGESQDFPAILDAVEILRGEKIRWLIVGDGRAADWLRLEVDRRGLHNKVLLLGRYPVERMPAFFQHADALLVSLRDEPVFSMTVPGKIQSYLATGIPVLAMLDGEGAQVVSQAGAGLCCPAGDSVKLANIVLELSRLDSVQRSEMGKLGREFYAKEYERGMLMDRLENHLLELMTGWHVRS